MFKCWKGYIICYVYRGRKFLTIPGFVKYIIVYNSKMSVGKCRHFYCMFVIYSIELVLFGALNSCVNSKFFKIEKFTFLFRNFGDFI